MAANPTPEECYRILEDFHVPEHVVEHSRKVRNLAVFLCRMLNEKGERLDAERVEAASLLHDIAKVDALNTGRSHSQAGADLVRELGFPAVAEIIRQHVILDPRTNQERIIEAEVVHYADKRVRHTTVVSLFERFQDLKERYGKSPAALALMEDLERESLLLEERLFRKISLSPDALKDTSGGRNG